MKQPTEKDLRNLSLLEKRLDKAREEKKALAAEKREIRRKLTAAEKKARDVEIKLKSDVADLAGDISRTEKVVKESEKKLSSQADQIKELIAENRRLAESLDDCTADAENLREIAIQASNDAKSARAEAANAIKIKENLEASLKKSEAEKASIQKKLTAAQQQLKEKKITPILQSDEVAMLFGELVDNIRGGLGGVSVRGGEIKLKLAFAAAGGLKGFVVPTPDAGPEFKENLHEIVIRFEQPLVTGTQTQPQSQPSKPDIGRRPELLPRPGPSVKRPAKKRSRKKR